MVGLRALTAVALIVVASNAVAQSGAGRRLTTVAALREYPGYFHLQNVLVHGELVDGGTRLVLRGGDDEIAVLLNGASREAGLVEVRGHLLDVGRLEPEDPRLREYRGDPDRWPRPGEELLLSVATVTGARYATSPSVRALALQPWRFNGHKVTIVGQFRGRNLFGDLPSTPGKTRYDFVLRYADAAVWVTDLRPRGRGFDLAVDARVDTGRWLEVSGILSQQRGLVTISGASIALASPPETPPVEEEAPPPPMPPEPAEVVFSSPTDGERDVPSTTSIRLQFSRGLDPASLRDRIQVTYEGDGAPMPPDFTQTYDPATRAVQIQFSRPLEPFRTVRVELLEGMRTFDGAPVRPSAIRFSVGN